MSNVHKHEQVDGVTIHYNALNQLEVLSAPASIDYFTIPIQFAYATPGNAETRFMGNSNKAPATSGGQNKIYLRKNCTIEGVELYTYAIGTVGTNENWSVYLRKNDTTDTLIATVGLATAQRIFSNAGLNVALLSGDYIELKSVTPTWATKPTQIFAGGYILLKK